MNLSELSASQLQELKKKWYQQALDEQKIANIYLVGINLGTLLRHNWGPKYEYNQEGLNIYIDDYGHYMTAEYKGRTVMSTHPNERLYVPGDWESLIPALLNLAITRNELNLKELEAKHKEKILSDLSSKPL